MSVNSDKPKMQLSDKVQAIPEALSVYMNNIVYAMKRRGDRIKVLSLGEAFFDIPMFSFKEIDFRQGYHYSESRGILELREIISKYYKEQYGVNIDPENEIIISAGSKPLIYMALQAVLNSGDEVLIHEPAWLSYPEEVKLANGIPVFIPYDSPVAEFPKYFTDRTRVLIINNPNNPAGKIYSEQDLENIYRLCRPRGIYVLVDEAYSDFVTDNSFTSMAKVVSDKDGIIVVNSLSKNLGISGWRVGYVVAKKEVIYNILKLNQHLITCPASILLLYLAKYFDRLIEITRPQARKVVEKRAETVEFMKTIGLKPLNGSATFYTFVNIDTYKYNSLDLALYLLFRYHISVVPGLAYGDSTERFIRIGVGAESMKDIEEALIIIKKVIDNNEFDCELIDAGLKELNMHHFSLSCQEGV